MILGAGIRDRPLLGSSGQAPHGVPPPREPREPPVQGVVVNPPRDSRVAVRVEIVTEPEDRRPRDEEEAAAPSPPPVEPSWRDASWFASVAEGAQQPAAASSLGAPNLRSAASAYRAHSDPYADAPRGGREQPALLSVRA